jgi:hypothetical protein
VPVDNIVDAVHRRSAAYLSADRGEQTNDDGERDSYHRIRTTMHVRRPRRSV